MSKPPELTAYENRLIKMHRAIWKKIRASKTLDENELRVIAHALEVCCNLYTDAFETALNRCQENTNDDEAKLFVKETAGAI